jgi:hypothetical protein
LAGELNHGRHPFVSTFIESHVPAQDSVSVDTKNQIGRICDLVSVATERQAWIGYSCISNPKRQPP